MPHSNTVAPIQCASPKTCANQRRAVPKFDAPGPFAQHVRQRGLAHLRSAPKGRFASRGQWIQAALALIAYTAFGALLFAAATWWPVAVAGASLAGFFILATLCHDAAHGALSPKEWLNKIAVVGGFGLFGISGALWQWRHVKLHHGFANVGGMDIDGEGSVLLRLAPTTKWYPWHRWQHLYAPFLYLLVFIHLAWLDDWRHLKMARNLNPLEFRSLRATLKIAAVKAAHLAIILGLPYLILTPSLGQLVLGYLIYMGIASLLFVIIVAGSHLSEEAEFVTADADGRIPHDWAEHQIMTAVDWSPHSPLAVALSGGSNAHSTHHLFPEAAQSHNAALSTIVAASCKAFGVRQNITDFRGMVASHFSHLAALSTNPKDKRG